jgi:hypothetical protein
MTRVFDRLLDALVPAATADAACTPATGYRCSYCIFGPPWDRMRLCRECYRNTNCVTYCSDWWERC